MLREVFEFALWLSVSLLILTVSLLEAVFGKKARILSWVLETFTLPVMAKFVSTPTMERIRSIFKQPIQRGEHPGKLYSIPVYQRKDGTTLRIGHLVERNLPQVCLREETSEQEDLVRVQKVHVINDILMTADMSNVTLSLNPVEGVNVIHSEEMLCDIDEVKSLPGKKVAATLAKKGIATIIRDIPTYPHHIQRTIRKHMLAASLRREVQKFLAGFSMAKTLSLGTLDWRHDPRILGLERSTDFSLDYHVEKYTSAASHLDILMGEGWDVRTISGTDGYRVVLTLELWVDLNFDIKVQIHGCLCSGSLDATSYRSTCLKVYTSPESRAAVSRLVNARSANNTRMTQDGSKGGISMAWDEFQPPSGETSPNRLPGIPSASTSLEDLIAGLSDPGTSTAMAGLDSALARVPSQQHSTAVGGLDDALARVPLRNNDLMFESPIKEESVNISSADGPNTSTPAECLDNSKEECEIFQATGSPVNSLMKIEVNDSSQPDGRETPRTLSPDQITVAEVEQATPILDQELGTSQPPEVDQVDLNMASKAAANIDPPHNGNVEEVKEEKAVPIERNVLLESDLNTYMDETRNSVNSKLSQSDRKETPRTSSPDMDAMAEVVQITPTLDQEIGTSQTPEVDQTEGSKAPEVSIATTSTETKVSDTFPRGENGKVNDEITQKMEGNVLEADEITSIDEKKIETVEMGTSPNQQLNQNMGSEAVEANNDLAYIKAQNYEASPKVENGDVSVVNEEGSHKFEDGEVVPSTSIDETEVPNGQHDGDALVTGKDYCDPNSNQTVSKITHTNEHDLKASEVYEDSLKDNELQENLSSNIVPEKTPESAIIKEKQLNSESDEDASTDNANGSLEEVSPTEDKEEFIKNNPEILSSQNKLSEENHVTAPPSSASDYVLLPETPAKGSSTIRVLDYVKSLPPTLDIEDKEIVINNAAIEVDNKEILISKAAVKNDLKEILGDTAGLEDDNKQDSSFNTDDSIDSKNVSLDEANVSMTPRKDDASLTGSQASSRMTGLSSQLSGRIGSGLFYGMVAQTAQPACPFPDEWQHGAIPESIENDDDLD